MNSTTTSQYIWTGNDSFQISTYARMEKSAASDVFLITFYRVLGEPPYWIPIVDNK